MRRTIRLRESELRRMISESVRRALNEFEDDLGFEDDAMDDEFPGDSDRVDGLPKYPFDDVDDDDDSFGGYDMLDPY